MRVEPSGIFFFNEDYFRRVICPYDRDPTGLLSLPTVWGRSEKSATWKRTLTARLAPWSRVSRLQNCEQYIFMVYVPPTQAVVFG